MLLLAGALALTINFLSVIEPPYGFWSFVHLYKFELLLEVLMDLLELEVAAGVG